MYVLPHDHNLVNVRQCSVGIAPCMNADGCKHLGLWIARHIPDLQLHTEAESLLSTIWDRNDNSKIRDCILGAYKNAHKVYYDNALKNDTPAARSEAQRTWDIALSACAECVTTDIEVLSEGCLENTPFCFRFPAKTEPSVSQDYKTTLPIVQVEVHKAALPNFTIQREPVARISEPPRTIELVPPSTPIATPKPRNSAPECVPSNDKLLGFALPLGSRANCDVLTIAKLSTLSETDIENMGQQELADWYKQLWVLSTRQFCMTAGVDPGTCSTWLHYNLLSQFFTMVT